MAIRKLQIEDFEEAEYYLLAIHTTLDNYRLAYFINQKLPILLSKSKKEIVAKELTSRVTFTKYIYEDFEKEIFWSLIENKKEISVTQKSNSQNLFDLQEEITNTFYLIPELKKVAYFIKIEAEKEQINEINLINELKKIDQVTTVYSVDKNQLKSINNLIF